MYKDVNKFVAIHIYGVIDISQHQIRMFPQNGYSSSGRENVASRVKVFFKAINFVPIVFIGPRSDHSLPMSLTHSLTD